jgi:DNA-binding transcriptional activator of the SARP family
MGQWTKARIQLCGRFVADIDGSRIEDAARPHRAVLFAYLVLNRGRPVPRDTLLMAGWGKTPPRARNALSVLLSKLRHSLGAEHLRGTDRDRTAPAAGDLRRRRGGPGGRPPGGVRHRGRTVGAGMGPGRDRLSRRHQAVPRPGWRRPGSTSGGAGWRRSGCAGWSALPPPASASAARRWPRPRNAPGC